MGIAPFALMMVTSYVKIVVVVSLVRNALGVQQVPPSTVLNGLAIVLSLFIHGPHRRCDLESHGSPAVSENATPTELIRIVKNSSGPLINFLSSNSEKRVKVLFERTARRIWPQDQQDKIRSDNLMIIIPSFTISELTKAFQIGFLLYPALCGHRSYHLEYFACHGHDDGLSHDHLIAVQAAVVCHPGRLVKDLPGIDAEL